MQIKITGETGGPHRPGRCHGRLAPYGQPHLPRYLPPCHAASLPPSPPFTSREPPLGEGDRAFGSRSACSPRHRLGPIRIHLSPIVARKGAASFSYFSPRICRGMELRLPVFFIS
ncbi:hypothetical protein E2C01_063625 [Portunus trituberculatus]|uniref:Uncharacterized protein n=1 Tax=Portunus trituberculatus TaxID=210409 RepID=A0A5B7HE66_PORTR|nr:hypothetical protein [Portunus trituberculatus]